MHSILNQTKPTFPIRNANGLNGLGHIYQVAVAYTTVPLLLLSGALAQYFAVLWIRIHFFRIRIRNQSLTLETRALMTKNLKKITAEKKSKFFFDQKLQFTYP